MPCRSDYLEPDARETESRVVGAHLAYLDRSGVRVDKKLAEVGRRAARATYGDKQSLDLMTAELCRVLGTLDEETQGRVLYDGRSREARGLASWWEDHQEADAERRARCTHRDVVVIGGGTARCTDCDKEIELAVGTRVSLRHV